MKRFFAILVCVSFFNSAYAFNLDEALSKIEDSAKKSVKDGGRVSLDQLVESVKKEANAKIAELEKKINGEIDKVVGEVNENIAAFKKMREQAELFVMLVKVVMGLMTFSIILILFWVWKLYRRTKKILSVVENVKNYKEIEKRVAKLEAAK